MIVFDLACTGGHVFEAWFGSQADYDGQQARGLVSCPICGDAGVGKAPMAPRISTGAAAREQGRAMERAEERSVQQVSGGGSGGGGAGGAGGGQPTAADMKAMMRAAMAMQAKLLASSEDVGTRFADEARAIHAGEADDRLIHGRTSAAEARKLAEEGVPVAPLPFPIRDPARDN